MRNWTLFLNRYDRVENAENVHSEVLLRYIEFMEKLYVKD